MDEEQYFRTVEDYFLQKRGNPMLLSPKEWSLIREWYELQVPCEVVLRGIDRAFEPKKNGEEKEVTSLLYCKRLVKSENKRYLKSLEGDAPSAALPGPPPADVVQFLERVVSALAESAVQAGETGNQAFAEYLESCSRNLSGEVLQPFRLNPSQDRQRVETQLTTMEKEIERVLLQLVSEQQIMRFKEDAMRELKSFEGKLDFAVYQEMLRRSLIKSIRRIYRIPRLSLFYM